LNYVHQAFPVTPSRTFTKNLHKTKMNIVLVLSGSLNPIHYDHVRIMNVAKEYLESKTTPNTKINVVKGFLCPSSEYYVNNKLKNEALSLKVRNDLTQIMIDSLKTSADPYTNTNWLELFDKGWANGRDIAKAVYDSHVGTHDNLVVYEVYGADFCLKTTSWTRTNRNIICVGRENLNMQIKLLISTTNYVIKRTKTSPFGHFVLIDRKVNDLSSTQIRRVLKSKDKNRWSEIVTKGWVHENVLNYLKNL
ncbi:unnamed protein product, partial [Yasminevirus sp. GU-2018]